MSSLFSMFSFGYSKNIIVLILAFIVASFLFMGVIAVFDEAEAIKINRNFTNRILLHDKNFELLSKALKSHLADRKTLPPVNITDSNGRPILSWRVALLPYLDEKKLFHSFRLNEPWDSPENLKNLEKIPDCYVFPFDPDSRKHGLTCFRTIRGNNGSFGGRAPIMSEQGGDFVLVLESSELVKWTMPDEPIDFRDFPKGIEDRDRPGISVIGATTFQVILEDFSVGLIPFK
jgi:hypothetical protein